MHDRFRDVVERLVFKTLYLSCLCAEWLFINIINPKRKSIYQVNKLSNFNTSLLTFLDKYVHCIHIYFIFFKRTQFLLASPVN